MIKLYISHLVTFGVSVALFISAFGTVQEMQNQTFADSIRNCLELLFAQLILAGAALFASALFAIAFIVYAWVNTAYAEWEKNRGLS